MDKITAESDAKALVEKLGEGWDYMVFNPVPNLIWYEVADMEKGISVEWEKSGFKAFYHNFSAKGDTAFGALHNLSAKLSNMAQQIDVFAFKASS